MATLLIITLLKHRNVLVQQKTLEWKKFDNIIFHISD